MLLATKREKVRVMSEMYMHLCMGIALSAQ
jgi:hypothetical protein